ncbi:MAG: FAD-dependent thymidylate synthase [Bryobacterales bacterium]|nr:FAD-dependent thymidylate synthase [Bryobacterales bacterium]
MPPEACAYALARYSRSPDSIRDSIEWVRSHSSQQFLESFYFQYGHASIADLGHVVLCLEGISELAAAEIEDEQLWDGQAKSSRYQDFSRAGIVAPPEFEADPARRYADTAARLLGAYQTVHARALECLEEKLPRPDGMKPDAYQRNLRARAFDVARYLLFWGIPTNVGQVTSIRTLEKQIRRLRGSAYGELRSLGDEMAEACARPPDCLWNGAPADPLAPTLARHAAADPFPAASCAAVAAWAAEFLPGPPPAHEHPVEVVRPDDPSADIAATLLYEVTAWPFRALYQTVRGWSEARRHEVIAAALGPRGRRDELPRAFRGAIYAFDIVMDIGAYRDLHRHRRCQQFRQAYGGALGYETPPLVAEAGATAAYDAAIAEALETFAALPAPGREYILPFATRGRFLFKMDFAEAEYISRLRSGVKGHFSYRQVAWEMKLALERLDPAMGRLIEATPPWVEDPLQR